MDILKPDCQMYDYSVFLRNEWKFSFLFKSVSNAVDWFSEFLSHFFTNYLIRPIIFYTINLNVLFSEKTGVFGKSCHNSISRLITICEPEIDLPLRIFFIFIYLGFSRQSFSVYFWLSWNSLFGSGWSWI